VAAAMLTVLVLLAGAARPWARPSLAGIGRSGGRSRSPCGGWLVVSGPQAACDAASAVAGAMGAGVVGCMLDELDVVVTVAVPITLGRLAHTSPMVRRGPGPVEGA